MPTSSMIVPNMSPRPNRRSNTATAAMMTTVRPVVCSVVSKNVDNNNNKNNKNSNDNNKNKNSSNNNNNNNNNSSNSNNDSGILVDDNSSSNNYNATSEKVLHLQDIGRVIQYKSGDISVEFDDCTVLKFHPETSKVYYTDRNRVVSKYEITDVLPIDVKTKLALFPGVINRLANM